jgi:hypothetical protein
MLTTAAECHRIDILLEPRRAAGSHVSSVSEAAEVYRELLVRTLAGTHPRNTTVPSVSMTMAPSGPSLSRKLERLHDEASVRETVICVAGTQVHQGWYISNSDMLGTQASA